MGAVVPYMPVNQVALDDDVPADPIALVCVVPGTHPFGNGVNLRIWDWNPTS